MAAAPLPAACLRPQDRGTEQQLLAGQQCMQRKTQQPGGECRQD